MSEWDAHVFCTCFQDGLTREPPYPRSDLTVNRFGVVTLVGSTDHSNDPDDLWCWRVGMTKDPPLEARQPCTHDNMKLFDEIFYWPGSYSHAGSYPTTERLIAEGDFPLLAAQIQQPPKYDFSSGGIWVLAQEAPDLLEEVRRLKPLVPAGTAEGDGYFVRTLQALLEASVKTGNPIITHYNGTADGAW